MKKLIFTNLAVILLLWLGLAYAANNFLSVQLPKGVTVDLPKNWKAMTENKRITLDSWLQAKMEASGIVDVKNDLAFSANYYDDNNKTAGTFSVRYYPDMNITESEARSASTAEINTLDAGLRKNVVTGFELAGSRLIAWIGTTKQTINGATFFVTDFRTKLPNGANFHNHLVRYLNSQKSFTIIITYREDQEFYLKPICDKIISSIRVTA